MIERRVDVKQTTIVRCVNGAVLPDDVLRDIHHHFKGDCEVTIYDPVCGPQMWRWSDDDGTWFDADGKPYAEVVQEGWRRIK